MLLLLFFIASVIPVISHLPHRISKARRSTQRDKALVDKEALLTVDDLFKQWLNVQYNSKTGKRSPHTEQLLMEIKVLLDEFPISAEVLYRKSFLQLELGNWFIAIEDKDQAMKALSSAEQYANDALKTDIYPADTHRVLAEALMGQIRFKGPMFTLSATSKIKQALKKAFDLAPKSAFNHIALGKLFFFMPPMAGGNPEKAIMHLRVASELVNSHAYVQFLARVWLGIVLASLNQGQEAQAAFEKALDIYPKSSWASKKLNELQKGGDSNDR